MEKKTKQIIIICTMTLLAIAIICGIVITIIKKIDQNNGKWITDNEFLYSKAIEYLKEEAYSSSHDKDKEDYHVFLDYKGFGIEEKNNKKYVYMHILEESYYTQKGKLRSSEGFSMLHKFIFENDEIVEYKVPLNGVENLSSIRDMCPDDIENDVIGYVLDSTKLRNEVKNYYSYLDSTDIVHTDSDENPIIIYGSYGGYTTKAEANTVKGKFIDRYGDIYEYKIPCDENEELSVDTEKMEDYIIMKFKGNKVGSISQDELKQIKDNLANVKEEYSDTGNVAMEDAPFKFIRVVYIKNDLTVVDYDRSNWTDLISYTGSSNKENTSEAGKNIINILKNYKII